MIEAGGHVKFEVSGEDLSRFAEQLIEKVGQLVARLPEPKKRNGSPKKRPFGNRNIYPLSAIERILNSRQTSTVARRSEQNLTTCNSHKDHVPFFMAVEFNIHGKMLNFICK